MTTSPDSHARHVLSQLAKEAAGLPANASLLQKLIADAIRKALSEDRETLRENMVCDPRDPCAFENVCGHHKALAGAMLANSLTTR
jgi:hypothetical protein